MPSIQALEEQERRTNELHAKAYGKDVPKGQGEPTAKPDATPAPTQNTTDANKATPPKVETEETWEARYKTLAGKYNAEVPRLKTANDALQGKLNEQTAQLNDVTARLKKLEDEKAQAPLVTKEEVDAFGEPLTDFTRRLAREEASKIVPSVSADEVASLKKELTELKEGTARTALEAFLDRLTELVPDWREINVDPLFHAYLGEIDPNFGMERQAGLRTAQVAFDAPRAARFFDAYKKVSSTGVAAAKDKLNEQVVPDTRQSAQLPTGKRVYTRGEIKEFYANWRAGRVSDADAIAMEAEINRALAEGRVR